MLIDVFGARKIVTPTRAFVGRTATVPGKVTSKGHDDNADGRGWTLAKEMNILTVGPDIA
jgi:hypothetical protein